MASSAVMTSTVRSPDRLTRWTPWLINLVAVLHFTWAIIQPNAWRAILADGFLQAAVAGSADLAMREYTIWFMVAGVANLAIGTLTASAVRSTGRVPKQVGWYLLAIGVPICALYFPVTGGWAPVAVGIAALAAAYRTPG